MTKLNDVFPFEDTKWRVMNLTKNKDKGTVAFYIDARNVMDRLDECGVKWSDEYKIIHRSDGHFEVECTLDVGGAIRVDVGEGTAVKDAYSDAFKRAAVKFGIGRYLYGLDTGQGGGKWLPVDQYKAFTPESETRIKNLLKNQLAKITRKDHTQTHIEAVNQQYGTDIEEMAKDLSWINGNKAKQMDAKADGVQRRAAQEPDSLGPYGDGSEIPDSTAESEALADAAHLARKLGPDTITNDQRKCMHAIGGQLYGDKDMWDSERHRLVGKLTNGRTNSSTELTVKEAGEFIDWLDNQFNRKMDKQRQNAETIDPPTSEVKTEQQIEDESLWDTSNEIPF